MNELSNLIWIDLEMTGLNSDEDTIIEIATVVTDNKLNVVAEGPCLAIYQKPTILAAMDAWNTKQHKKSGLVERVNNSIISLRQAETQTLKFLAKFVAPKTSPMCGNSIHQDRSFLRKYMPTLEEFFHYRHIDVSTLKELAVRWQLKTYVKFSKKSAHLALSDIYDSIDELKHYRRTFIKD